MMNSADLNNLAQHDRMMSTQGMEQQESPHKNWVKGIQDEIEQINEKLDRLDGQGMIDHRLRSRLNELQVSLANLRRFKEDHPELDFSK